MRRDGVNNKGKEEEIEDCTGHRGGQDNVGVPYSGHRGVLYNACVPYRFNQDESCFAVAPSSGGFIIFGINPVRERFCRAMNGVRFAIVEPLFKTNIVVLVGAANNNTSTTSNEFPPSRVAFWEDQGQRVFAQLDFPNIIVRNVLVRSENVVVVLDRVVNVYTWANLDLIGSYATCQNELGVCALSYHPRKTCLAIPAINRGVVQIIRGTERGTKRGTKRGTDFPLNPSANPSERGPDFSSTASDNVVVESSGEGFKGKFVPLSGEGFKGKPVPLRIVAHDGDIALVKFNSDATLMATCSHRGTVIRLWAVPDLNYIKDIKDPHWQKPLREFQRGTSPTTIFYISFSRDSSYMMVGSATGTVHVYSLRVPEIQQVIANTNNATGNIAGNISHIGETATNHNNAAGPWSLMANILPIPSYFTNDWSCVSFKPRFLNLVSNTTNGKLPFFGVFCEQASGPAEEGQILIILVQDKTYYKYHFQPNNSSEKVISLLEKRDVF